jgi:hypothetical protein
MALLSMEKCGYGYTADADAKILHSLTLAISRGTKV